MSLIKSVFTPQEIDSIASIPISLKGVKDPWVWLFTMSGKYTSCSGYVNLSAKFLRHNPLASINIKWQLI